MSDPDQCVTLADIRAAAGALTGQVERTPFRHSLTLSEITGAQTWLKFENLQFTAAFKERGAYNKLISLSPEQQATGVIAMSAGNHAQAVAYHARRLGIPATIVMPKNTPVVKVRNTRAHQARVILHGKMLRDSAAFAHELAESEGLCFVHPFDDPLIIAGQGTVALEMLKEVPDLECLIVPVGGGGLISGVAVAAKALRPEIEIIGVESALYPAIKSALDGVDRRCGGATLAEGIAVTEIGRHTLPLIRRYVDDIVLVEEPQLEHAVALLLNVEKTLVEGAGAAGLAAILAQPERFRGRQVGTILCGGNIDDRLLTSLLTRELVRQGRITRMRVAMPDVPGELARLSGIVAEAGGNFIEVLHNRIFSTLPAKDTYLEMTLETRDREHLDLILGELAQAGYEVRLLGMDSQH